MGRKRSINNGGLDGEMRKVCFIHLLETYKTPGNYMFILQIPNVKTISIQSVTDWIEIRLNDFQSYFIVFLCVFT